MISDRKAVIFGISSYKLKNIEKKFLKNVKPWGIILFSRNIKDLLLNLFTFFLPLYCQFDQ